MLSRFFLATVLFPSAAFPQAGGEITLAAGTRITIQLNDYLSTKINNEGDPFTATVTDPVMLKDRIVIPKGSIVSGSVSRVLKPGRFKGKAMMNLLFSAIRLPGTPDIPITASLTRIGKAEAREEGTIAADGAKTKEAAKIVVPTIVGGGIGAIVSGGQGAVIGAGIGAAVGILTGRGSDLEVTRGTEMEIVLDRPLILR